MADERAKKPLVIALAVLAVTCCGLGVAGYLRGAPAEETLRFYLRNDSGPVLFEHAGHGAALGDCVSCHHELATDVCSCLDCHDDPDYTADAMSHDELLENHDRACDTCHLIADQDEAASCRECHEDELAKIYHLSCNNCHLATAPEIFADDAGEARCRSCHLR